MRGEQTKMCLTAMQASTFFYPVPFFVVRDQADRNGDLGHALPHSSLNIPGESAQMHHLLDKAVSCFSLR
jgi:hypothetical protein